MSYRMLEDSVLILPLQVGDEKSNGGIALPSHMAERPVTGTVMAVGPGMKLESGDRFPSDLKVGSLVVFPKKSGDKIHLDGHDFVVIPERYILLVVSEPDEEEESSDTLPDGLKDTPENRAKMQAYKNGDMIPVDDLGNIIEPDGCIPPDKETN